MNGRRRRILIADDDAALRTELRSMVTSSGRYEVIGEAADGAEALALVQARRCDVILLDLSMPRRGGLEILHQVARLQNRPRVVVLSMHDDAVHVDRALGLGADGYVHKAATAEEILAAIDAAIAGGAYLHPPVARAVLDRHLVLARPPERPAASLSRRQRELLQALAMGMSNKQIAGQLGITEVTVKGYLKELYSRLGVESRAAAAAVGIRRGLIG